MSDYRFMRFEIEGLGKKIAAMIGDQANEMEGGVKRAFEDLAAEGMLEAIINDAVRAQIAETVKEAVRSRAVTDAIAALIAKELRKD